MAQGRGLHSRLVAVLKVGLPLVALLLLASLFLIPPDDRLEGELVFSRGDIAALGSGLRITRPTFSGMTRDEDPFRFTADLVVPDAAPPTRAAVTGLSGTMEFEGGPGVSLASQTAELDLEASRIALEGAVRLETTDGYRMTAPAMDVDLGAGVLEAVGPVETEGPMGRIEAGLLRIAPGPEGPRVISFGDGVRLVYRPVQVGR